MTLRDNCTSLGLLQRLHSPMCISSYSPTCHIATVSYIRLRCCSWHDHFLSTRLSLSLPSSLPPPLRELAFLIVLATVAKYLMRQDGGFVWAPDCRGFSVSSLCSLCSFINQNQLLSVLKFVFSISPKCVSVKKACFLTAGPIRGC